MRCAKRHSRMAAGHDTLALHDEDSTPMDISTPTPAFIIVSADDIARRAYELYLERGCADGLDREDWLRAERELKTSQPSVSVDSRRRSRRR
jgi:Protein of unknown function (DUF2934)